MTDLLGQSSVREATTDELWAITTKIDVTPTVVHPPDELWAPAGPNGRPPARTTLPVRPSPGTSPPAQRPIGKISRNELLMMFGAMLSSLSITMLVFGRLAALSGRFGFVVLWFVMFVVIYGLLISMVDNRPAVVDRVMATLLTAATAIAGIAVLSVILNTFWEGRSALAKWNFYTQDMSAAGPLDPISVGGISHAIVGTLIIIGLSMIFSVPLALVCAVYLTETRGKITEFVRSVVTAMTALPSIVAGLFIFATWVLILGQERSGIAAAFAVSIMMLPIIIRSADVVLRLVPGNLREASAALGAPQYRTVWHVVLPTARPGLATSVILGVARGIGETAPVLLVSGITGTMNTNPLANPMMSLPLATFQFVRTPVEAQQARGFATAAVLMILVLILFAVARILGGRQAGQLSKRQRRKAVSRSTHDMARIEAADHERYVSALDASAAASSPTPSTPPPPSSSSSSSPPPPPPPSAPSAGSSS